VPNLYIMAGVPGSGKSTFAKQLLSHARIVSSDEIRKGIFGSLKLAHDPAIKEDANRLVWTTFHDEIARHLSNLWDVVADATFLTARSRERVRDIAERYDAKTHLIIIGNLTTADQRNAARPEESRVPEDVQEFMHEKYFNLLSEYPQESYTTVTKIARFG
jgi:predicted kinase